jgi:ribosomal protein S18 acetylase RimI-like enzyme
VATLAEMSARGTPDHFVRFWRALDGLFGRVRPTRWGGVVTDGRFPDVWDTNYARVDVRSSTVSASEVEQDLLPALHEAGATQEHVVSFHPEDTRSLLSELSSRGHRLTWDLVMDLRKDPPTVGASVDHLSPNASLWDLVQASLQVFGVEGEAAADQLRRIERDVLVPAGKRWFGIREPDGRVASLGALVILEGVGYIDNVATFPRHRRRGYATAVTAAMVREARSAGAEHVCLLADPDADHVVHLYERLGFRPAGRLASTRGPTPPDAERRDAPRGRPTVEEGTEPA